MKNVFIYSGIFLSLLMLLSLYRAVFGPTVLDRLLGVNAIGSKTTTLLILIGLISYAMLNFIAVLAASRYFQKQKGLYDEGPRK
jgi:multicomponent Na+:H+ antiporter subunit F